MCPHTQVECLNPYTYVRKYRCLSCREIMMCACDEERGKKYLPHQLRDVKELKTQERLRVTLGFQSKICRECRGLPAEAQPRAEMIGQTSKIKRYYWREIFWREQELLSAAGFDLFSYSLEAEEAKKKAKRIAIDEMTALHREKPKYTYLPESSIDELRRDYGLTIENVDGIYLKKVDHTRVCLLHEDNQYSAEGFAAELLRARGYSTLFLESIPIHVLFGAFCWSVVEDVDDPLGEPFGFGNRDDYDADIRPMREIWHRKSQDFGSEAYFPRRKEGFDVLFRRLESEDLLTQFDEWLPPSENLRQYLWAHKPEHVRTARALLSVVPKEVVLRILRYVAESYWDRYLGWPDLIAYREADYLFVEVKASKDTLSADQTRWIKDNYEILKLPFQLLKIHRKSTVVES